MFKIRREQKDAFRTEALLDFEERMLAHVRRCFPERAPIGGDAELCADIRAGIARAIEAGFVAERDVCRFVDLTLVFGAAFERRCPWAQAILGAGAGADPLATIHALFERALNEL